MGKRFFIALLPVAILVALPLLLRPAPPAKTESGKEPAALVLVTAHSEAIRRETEMAFRAWHIKKYGRDVRFDWRNVGGTSDIVRYVTDRYEAEFRRNCESDGIKWNDQLAHDFKDIWTDPEKCEIRKRFLDSKTGIGIDLFFGGGTFDHSRFADIGFGVDAGTQTRHPEWFTPDVIPQTHSGEAIYDPHGRYYGVFLSSFGIAYNTDRYHDLGLPYPESWEDLADARLFQAIEVADPTKSGSITKCYEMILQQMMAKYGPEEGWQKGFLLIKLIAANSRQIIDSAGKLVRDVSSGSAAACMCIDFYGFSEAQYTAELSGSDRVHYQMPKNGSSVSADPIQLLRGAPNEETAKEFIDFLLSPEGQRLSIQKPGTPDGPKEFAILRPCVRKDLYATTPREWMNNPDYCPYTGSGTFRYQGKLTGKYFSLIRVLIKCIVLDPQDQLREAWRKILQNGGPEANPEAMKLLAELPVPYSEAEVAAKALSGSPVKAVETRRHWTEYALRQYRKAADAVKEKEPDK